MIGLAPPSLLSLARFVLTSQDNRNHPELKQSQHPEPPVFARALPPTTSQGTKGEDICSLYFALPS